MKKSRWIKIGSSAFALSVLTYGLFLGSQSQLLQPLSDWLSPQVQKDLRGGDMGYRKKPKALDESMDKEDAEMMSFLDHELQVQRDIASSIKIDFTTEKNQKKQAKADKDDPLQLVLIKKEPSQKR